jgi:predicted HAD superfamily Cof-like phosphohydrolase
MQTDFNDVREFHRKFALPIDDRPLASGEVAFHMEPEVFHFRLGFLKEEAFEFDEAFGRGNLVKTLDALMDLVYVTFGTALFMGAGENCFARITWPSQRSVLEWAEANGCLVGRPMYPQLMHVELFTVIHGRMFHEIDAFKTCHQMEHQAGLPMALLHLWNLAWVAYLGAALMNCPWSRTWRHVQAANMAKARAQADASDSKRKSSFDVVKPLSWTSPDAKIATELALEGAILPDWVIAEATLSSQPRA